MTTTKTISVNNSESVEIGPWNDDDLDDLNFNELGKILDDPLPKEAFEALRTNEQNFGFNNNVGNTWMYPNNLPMRSYQYSITKAALFKNTLVVLPTGLGKTFIAAVVMYNIYRWYPTGKVIFVAPTRPLVAQQIQACQKIMPFPLEDTIELTGKLQREKRLECWRGKRVFFATPQSLQADMISQGEDVKNFPYEQVKLIVFDEAHKAKGRYAYVEVAQALHQRNKYFRVLALSATPGRTMDDVAEVIRNLFISHLEVRWDTSIDVVQYVHQRHIKTVVVALGDNIKRIREKLIQIIDPYMRQLIEAGVVSGTHQHTTRNSLVMEQKRFHERSLYQTHPQKSAVNTNFSICISLFHALELLERHGLRVFLNYFEDDEEGRTKYILAMNRSLSALVTSLSEELGPNPFDISAQVMTNGCFAEMPTDLDFGHPKFEEARKCILEHFESNPESRAIVFCEYRTSVMMIFRLLLQHAPLIKPKCFVGQGGTGSLRAVSQKQQVQIMNDFRSGKINILIATSIGEEGIDVGEVDLIVCFDINTSNPTRFVQRIGRTGRQRRGNVIMLVSEGKEQQILQDVMANKDQTNKKLANSSRSHVVQTALYKHSPRMVPTEFNPECVQIHVRPRSPVQNKIEMKTKRAKTESSKINGKKSIKPKETLVENTQDLRKFFKKPELKLDDEDLEVFETQTQQKSTSEITQQSMERIKRIFKDIQPLSNSNSQLLSAHHEVVLEQSITTASPLQQQKTIQTKLDIKEIKKLNKFLKSSIDVVSLTDNLKSLLKSTNCSKVGKLLLLKNRYVQAHEICEQMDILQVLEQDINDMSTEECEIRETFQNMLSLFDDRNALNSFLEDAEIDAKIAKKREKDKSLARNEFDMTDDHFQQAMQHIFKDLDLQGSDWDSFDYRQQELKKTKAYERHLTAKSKKNNQNNEAFISMVFEAVPIEHTTTHFDNFDDINMQSLTDSKYCSQWEDDFKPSRVNLKSTPLNGPLFKAFEKQKIKQPQARKRLETTTLNEPQNGPTFENDDIIFLPLENEENNKKCDKISLVNDDRSSLSKFATCIEKAKSTHACSQMENTKTNDLLAPLKDFEASFMQRQQSTPLATRVQVNDIKFKKTKETLEQIKSTANKKMSFNAQPLQNELEMDLDAFLEPLPEEIELLGNKTDTFSGSSSKENCKLNDHENKTLNDASESKKSFVSLFELLENKPVNSVMTPKRTFMPSNKTTPFTTPKITTPTTTTPQMATNRTPQLFDTSCDTTPSYQKSKLNESPLNYQTSLTESPKCRPSTSQLKKHYKTSPSILSTYTKGVERLDSKRKMTLTNLGSTSSLTEIDSPIRRKPNPLNAANLKRKIDESDSEMNETPTISGHSSNSDDDFEEIKASPQVKRRRLSQSREKVLRRARLSEFFDNEAEKSGGPGHTDEEDDFEETYGSFVCNTMAVENEEVDENAPTATQMQAIYLQSVRSPQQRRGAFKIPEARTYDTNINIYSQVMPLEPSQSYGQDSFVVHDDEETLNRAENTTLCPLEQAERILKEQRRQAKRRRCAEVEAADPIKKRVRKCYQIDDSSEDDGGG